MRMRPAAAQRAMPPPAPHHSPDDLSEPPQPRLAPIANSFIYRTDLPGETSWGPWQRTALSTWSSDVRPVVDFIQRTTGFGASTYNGHDPSIGRAADIRPNSRANHTKLANWLKTNIRNLGIQYIVASAQIYNIARASEGVRLMADRGSITQNHQDHVHISFITPGPIRTNLGAVTSWSGA